jgi:hypothetical protein
MGCLLSSRQSYMVDLSATVRHHLEILRITNYETKQNEVVARGITAVNRARFGVSTT